jgi:MarR family transcriptional regulator, transcriptional regulator for hemolysin
MSNYLLIAGHASLVVMKPARTPIGLHLNQAARIVSRAFDAALAQAGGSLPVWLVLLNLKIRPEASQRELADAIGVSEATLTHHLNAMEAEGLLGRRRDPANRRVHIVKVTETGEDAFRRLRDAAMRFDRQLLDGFADTDANRLGQILDRLVANVSGERAAGPTVGRPGRDDAVTAH